MPEYLKRSGMTQAEYSRRIGVSGSFANKVMTGEKKLSLTKAKMTADLFNCTIDDLYDWETIPDNGKR